MTAVLMATLGVTAVVVVPSAQAANTTPFTSRFSTNANGAIITIGNNLLTCPTSASNCTAARAGAAVDNNSFNMVNLDADSVGSTFNSSSSTLNLPAGSSVLWAGLYWGARLDAGTGGAAGKGTRTQMQLQVPAGSYQTVTSSQEFGPNTTSNNAYQEFANITTQVQAAGNGAYWGANVVAGTGQDRYAGWAMTVVYTAPGLPLRNLTVFDGFNVVNQGNPQNITVSGFQAPQAGTVDTQLSMVAYEGDLSQTGDFTKLDNTQLATTVSPGSNFFDSVNERGGASVQTRIPADVNMLGFDIKNLGASGAIPNGATSATFTFSSNGDVYYPGVLGMAINLYAPDFTASSKTVVDLNGNNPARPGDTMQYTLNYANTGQDPAVGVVSADPLPPNTAYVPGSLQLVNPATGTTKPLTDTVGDDQGEISGQTIRVRLGSGASGSTGGRMACSGTGCADDGTSRTAYTFQVTLNDAAGGTTVTNVATLSYRTSTTNIAATYTTIPATVDVTTRADLSITKVMTPDPSFVGSEIDGTITITNHGPNTAQNVTMRDPIIDGWINDSVDAPAGVACTVDTVNAVINCGLGDVPNGQSVTIVVHGHMASNDLASTLTNVAYVDTDSLDPDLTDNVASDSISLQRVADLAITKTPTPANAPPGSTVSYTLTVTNNGPSDAQNVVISDAVDDQTQLGLTNVTATSGGATCTAPQGGNLNCTDPTLPAGATATVIVQAVIGSDLAAGVTVGNTATVASSTADPDSSNNQATGEVTSTAAQSDVRIAKTAPASAVAGEKITYTITATNFGPSDATGVFVADRVPPNVSFLSASTSRGTCVVVLTLLRCAAGTLPAAAPGQPGASVTITVTGIVDSIAPTGTSVLVNTATVRSTTADPDSSNNSATATSDVTRNFDLAVTKQANRNSLPGAAPRSVDYTITITNNGPSAADGIVLTDLIPSENLLHFISATPASGACSDPAPTADPDHDQLTCTLSDTLVPGDSATVQVDMEAEGDLAAQGQPITETATVTAPGDDQTQLDNNSATWTLQGQPESDLSLTKTAPATVTAGTIVTYEFLIANNADPEFPLTALAPTIVDDLPDGVTLVPSGASGSVTPSFCTAQGQTVTCDMPSPDRDIPPNQATTVDISVLVAPDLAPGTSLANTAAVVNRPSNPDPAPANNVDTASSIVTADADVAVSGLTIDPTDPTSTGPGSQRAVHFTLTNNGPSTAKDVTFHVTRSTDAEVTLPPALASNCTSNTRELVCTIPGNDLAPGQTFDVDYTLTLPGYDTPGSFPDTVHVSSTTPDTNASNNDANTPLVIGPAHTDLHITKGAIDTVPNPNGDGHQAYVAGETFAFPISLSVPNTMGSGLADAQNVELTDPMPAGFTATLVSTTQGTCSVTGGGAGASCDLGTVAAWPGGAQPITATVYGTLDVGASGEQITNTATATSSTPGADGSPTSVDASVAVDVIEQADLRLFKVADASTFVAGGSVGYTLTAVNAGPSDVGDASITDHLPVGLTLDTDNSPGCTVTSGTPATGQQVSCTVGAVPVGTSTSVRVVATTDPGDLDVPRTITNTATVTSPTATDPDLDNNNASVDATLDRLADLAITSSVSTTTPAAGGEITYTAVTINNGPSAAANPFGKATFPAGFVPVSFDVPGNICSWDPTPPAPAGTSYTLNCTADPTQVPNGLFEPGAAVTSVVVMRIPGDTPAGSYTANAEFHTSTPESDLTNNTTSQTVVVQQVSDTHITKALVEPNPMQAGRPATWRLTITNDGPSDADNTVISDTVPENMTFASASNENGTACPAPEIHDLQTIVKCPMGTLAAGQSASALVTLNVGADTTGSNLCNAALVGSGSLDPNASDNESQSCNVVGAPPATDVSLTETPAEQIVNPGDQVAFTATVTNNGPNDATSVVATFQIPDGLQNIAGVLVTAPDGSTAQANCVVDALTCTIGNLAPGQSVTYHITGTATGTPGQKLTLAGVVVHNEQDGDTTNDAASAVVDLANPTPITPPPPGHQVTPPPGTGVAPVAPISEITIPVTG